MSQLKTVGEAAEELGVAPTTIRNWVEKGYIQAYRLPSGHRRIPQSEIVRMLTVRHVPELGEELSERRTVTVDISGNRAEAANTIMDMLSGVIPGLSEESEDESETVEDEVDDAVEDESEGQTTESSES